LLKAVTKAKINAKAFFHPKPKTKPGPGAPRKKGDKVKVASLFETMANSFTAATALMYGEMSEISYYCAGLLWGEQWYQNLRFVLVWYEGRKSILVSTDLTLLPIEIIELYCHRFKIECAFRELKQVIAGFGYQFWSKHMPKLNRYKSNGFHQEQQNAVTEGSKREAVLKTVKAIECFTLLSCIALGMLQMISLLFSDAIAAKAVRFMRTPSKVVPSEATVADFMRKSFYQLFYFFPNLAIAAIIKSKQVEVENDSFGSIA
jgi:hypothetical protein